MPPIPAKCTRDPGGAVDVDDENAFDLLGNAVALAVFGREVGDRQAGVPRAQYQECIRRIPEREESYHREEEPEPSVQTG